MGPRESSQPDAPAPEQPRDLIKGVKKKERKKVAIAQNERKEFSPLILTILGAIGTGFLAILNSFLQSRQEQEKFRQSMALEQEKFRETIILKAMEPAEPDERKKALKFFVDVGLLMDPDGKINQIKAEDIPQNARGKLIRRIGSSDVMNLGQAIVFSSGMDIDVVGAPQSYHPEGKKGLDDLGNAGKEGSWWALVTDDGKPTGRPVIQKAQDPAPGYYISATSLQDESKDRTDPRRYVDSSTMPYIVIPGHFTAESGVKLGDIAAVYCKNTEKLSFAVVADIGPSNRIGEGSIALAKALGIPSDAKTGGVSDGVLYIVFPNSGGHWPMTVKEIDTAGTKLFQKWGGLQRIKDINSSAAAPASPSNASASRTTTEGSNPSPSVQIHANIDRSNIESRLAKIVVEQLGVNPDQIVPTADLVDDLGADSTDLVELIMATEEEFKITIPDDDAERVRTFGDACNYVAAHLNPVH